MMVVLIKTAVLLITIGYLPARSHFRPGWLARQAPLTGGIYPPGRRYRRRPSEQSSTPRTAVDVIAFKPRWRPTRDRRTPSTTPAPDCQEPLAVAQPSQLAAMAVRGCGVIGDPASSAISQCPVAGAGVGS